MLVTLTNKYSTLLRRMCINAFIILLRGFVLRDLVYSISDSNHLVPKCVFLSNIGRGNLFLIQQRRSLFQFYTIREKQQLPKKYTCVQRKILQFIATTLPHTNKIYVYRSFTPKCCFICTLPLCPSFHLFLHIIPFSLSDVLSFRPPFQERSFTLTNFLFKIL